MSGSLRDMAKLAKTSKMLLYNERLGNNLAKDLSVNFLSVVDIIPKEQ